MSSGYRSLDEKPYHSHYLHEEVILDHPVDAVWPQLLRIGEWMSAHRLETLSGTACEVGHFERVYPRDIGSEVGQPHYHLYGIAYLIPNKYIALEVLPERGGSYGKTREWMSFDGLILSDLGDRTQLTFILVDVHMGHGSNLDYEERARELEEARELVRRYFINLKELLAKH